MTQADLIILSHLSSYSDWSRGGHVTQAEPINILPWDVSTGEESLLLLGDGTQRL